MSFKIEEGGILNEYTGEASEVIVPDGITVIKDHSFSSCKSLRKVIMPKTLTSIQENAFANCVNLESIIFQDDYIPNNIAVNAFWNCPLLQNHDGLFILRNICYGGPGINGVATIPNSVTQIVPSAFELNPYIREITIPGSIKTIPYKAFENCPNINRVSIEDGVETIQSEAFTACNNLPGIILPDSIQQLQYNCFSFCSSLNHIVIPNSVQELPSGIFDCCNSLTDISIPTCIDRLPRNSFNRCGFTEVLLPEHIKKIDPDCFGGYYLSKISILHNVEAIPSFAFSSCHSLKELFINDGTVTFGRDILYKITVPSIHISVKAIPALTDENKLNAVRTFLKTKETYSVNGQKGWITYIKRNKLRILQKMIKNNDAEGIQHIFAIVTLNAADKEKIDRSLKMASGEIIELINSLT